MKLIITLLLFSFGARAEIFTGKVTTAFGSLKHLKGSACEVEVLTADNYTLDVRLSLKDIMFDTFGLEPHFDGVNLYAPLYRVPKERIGETKFDLKVILNPKDTSVIESIVVDEQISFWGGLVSDSAFKYQIECFIQ